MLAAEPATENVSVFHETASLAIVIAIQLLIDNAVRVS